MLKPCIRALTFRASSQETIPLGRGLVQKTCAEALQGQKKKKRKKNARECGFPKMASSIANVFPSMLVPSLLQWNKQVCPDCQTSRFLAFTQTFSFRRHPDMIDETMVCTQVFFSYVYVSLWKNKTLASAGEDLGREFRRSPRNFHVCI